MGIFDGCLLASDIDGTLVENGEISERNFEKVDFFLREGGRFSLCTGRSVSAIEYVRSKFKYLDPCILANGCMAYDYNKKEILFQHTLEKEDYKIARMVQNCGLNIGIEIHCEENVFTLRRTKETDIHQEYEGLNGIPINFEEVSKYNWNKALYTFESAEDREKFKELIGKEKTNSRFIDTIAMIYGQERYYHEQLPKGVSKFSAIKQLAEILNIRQGGLFAIGDYYNDLEMIKNADIGAATCDAPDEVKNAAKFITGSCEDGAVADFIDYLTEKFK
ncbi:MAG: HAD-IIB family hydrolase [Ruminococcaceae bacterium]|nr:HAD-IIB family hydrolase [Oscillospiraceae bacterium]